MDVRCTAARFLDHHLSQRNLTLADLGVPPTVVVTWFRNVAERLARAAGADPVEHWPGGMLYRGEVEGVPVAFTHLPVGAPGTVVHLEELAAAGARRFVGLGLAGSLQEAAPVGSFLLPGSCIREEGTSPHYLPADAEVVPHAGLQAILEAGVVGAGLKAHCGRHWTTDAPYREFVWKIERYRAEGVFGVDMETSAMYALGQFHGLPVANLLVVSDELWHEWRPAFGSDELRAAMDRAEAVILAALPAIARVGAADGQG